MPMILMKFQWNYPNGAPSSGGVGKNCVFQLAKKFLQGSNALPQKSVHPPRWSVSMMVAGGAICNLINNVGWSKLRL